MRFLTTLGTACLLAATAQAQASITFIAPGNAEAVTPDGTYVTGTHSTGVAYVWDQTNGLQLLGGQSSVGISADGSTLFGGSGTSPVQPAIWNNNAWTDLGGIPGDSGCPELGSAYALSDDGLAATGLGWNQCKGVCFKWTPTTGMVELARKGPNARGNAISGNGGVIGGWDSHANGTRRASLWLPNGQERLLLEGLPGNAIGAGETWGLSTNGTYAVGHGLNGAFRWTSSGGPQMLGVPAGANSPAAGMGVTDDGKIIVGTSGTFFTTLKAFIWTEADGMVLLDDYVASLGLTLPPGVSLLGATDITPDGRTVVGFSGTGPFNTSAFVLRLPEYCGWSTYGNTAPAANVLEVTGGGDWSLGGVFSITTTGIVGPVSVTAIGFAKDSYPFLGGTGLIDVASFYGYVLNAAAGGTSTTLIAMPTNPTLAGLTAYFQSLAPDAAQSQGWALSNGLELVICP